MPVIRADQAQVHQMHNARFISYVRPEVGSADICQWRVEIDAETTGQEHRLLREETFVMLDGTAILTIDGESATLAPGDAALAPAGVTIRLDNPGSGPAALLVTAPVGFAAELADGTRISPPWVN
ncbi:cupin domain-containing protein [Nocardia pseudobrasiliensis]|uniref:Mannose-6-phosphate isomerase-like protein (Cupin superfamily) n=1 Tax=Nocardia pseudobrasiliensis TaxID=45979 RepID=A0A370I0K1_9NOCA|nr:cupin domain-containing protein [Nocardia pseudobrasiliensis]RDI62744.1 mannose-6-phosphate isomerase-like protein (cupin superfamily) [Nocardia pseudobrasiliensis]